MKSIEIKAGERVRVINKFSNSLSMTYNFGVQPVIEGEDVSGLVEIEGTSWIFSKPISSQKLSTANAVQKGVWDSKYSVYVTPDVDVVLSLGKADFSKMWPLIIFGLAVTGAALAIVFSMGFYG